MEIKIEVGEERFKDVLEKELEAFSKGELHDICKKALLDQLSNPDIFRELFVKKTEGGDYWHQEEKYYANDLLREAAKSVNFEPVYKDIQDKIVSYITEHHMDIIHEMVCNMFVDGLSKAITSSSEFASRVNQEVFVGINWHEQNLHKNGQ